MANTTRIKDLSSVTTPSDSDVIAVDGANGTKGITCLLYTSPSPRD